MKNEIEKMKIEKRKDGNNMLEKVKEIIEEQLNIEGVEITEETSFKED